MLRALPLLLLLTLFSSACNSAEGNTLNTPAREGVTTIYLVRHAEKGDGEDPDLTSEGSARAARLAQRLSGTDLAAVYTTDTKRTHQTADPTATAQGLETFTYSPDRLGELADNLLRDHAGETILVVGHSNTTPALANQLAGQDTQNAFDDSDYGNILVVTVPTEGTARIENLRY
ncbi:phosphoglycerate mutase family protein [Lewinella sp. IMCC34183]|uniref:phosphoglycerate mutase family protein n=1 Tax=Lewinella sp. IMCC34183 TaxID=2248762 RepID=UPI000E229AE9|nr:phosphoglycerate mutase family protein [Lewinella sp. IMCC34183]